MKNRVEYWQEMDGTCGQHFIRTTEAMGAPLYTDNRTTDRTNYRRTLLVSSYDTRVHVYTNMCAGVKLLAVCLLHHGIKWRGPWASAESTEGSTGTSGRLSAVSATWPWLAFVFFDILIQARPFCTTFCSELEVCTNPYSLYLTSPSGTPLYLG